jgi:hypothetical protein
VSTLLWVLGAALVALGATRVALQVRAGSKSPLHALAREYLTEQLAAHGIADQVPARCKAEVAERYAGLVQSRPLGRIAAASELMRHIDAAVACLAQWVREGRAFPRSAAELPLPGLGLPQALEALQSADPED